jgi:CRP-like cAMP-binding protein
MVDSSHQKINNDVIEKVRQIPALSTFEERDINELMQFSKLMKFKPGDLIIAEGCYEGWIYYLISGKARIIKNAKELTVLQRTGDIFGEMSVIDGSARSASVYAVDDTTCLAIDVSGTDAMALDNKLAFRYIIYRDFAEVLANRLRITTNELVRVKGELEKLNLVRRLTTAIEELAAAKAEINTLKKELGRE